MKTLGEVFDSQFGINLPQQISQGELTQLNINKQARLITLAVKFNGLVERNTLFDTEKLITKTLAYHTVIKPHFPTELFSADYFPQLYAAVRRDIPSINGTLNNAEVRFENNTLTINLLNGGKTLLDSKGFDKALIKLISEEFNLYISVNYTGTFEVEENSEEYKAAIQDAQEKINRENLQKAAEFYQEEVESAEKREEKHAENTTVEIEVREGKFATPQIIQSSIRPLYGRSIRGKMIPISSISGDSGRIVVWGDVFDIEKKVTKSGDKNIFTIDITDYTGSTTAKVFNSIKESAVIDNIKKGDTIVVPCDAGRGRL